MAECAYCKAETHLYQSGTPICIKCAEAAEAKGAEPLDRDQVRRILLQDVSETTARLNAASEEFQVILSTIPSGMPHPDGAQRIHQASHKLSTARKDMMQAHSRLNDFLSSGVVPEDLKRAADGE